MHEVLLLGDSQTGIYWERWHDTVNTASVLRKNGIKVKVVELASHLTLKGLERLLRLYVTDSTKAVIYNTYMFAGGKEENDNYYSLNLDNILRNELIVTDYDEIYAKHSYDIIKSINNKCKVIFLAQRNVENVLPYADYVINNLFRSYEIVNILKSEYIIRQDFLDSGQYSKTVPIFTDDDMVDSREWPAIQVGYGCAFNCPFCHYPHRSKTTNNFLKDFKSIRDCLIDTYEKYGVTSWYFHTPMFNESFEYCESFYNKVARQLPFDLEFMSYIRPDTLYNNKPYIETLRKCGLRSAGFGVESTNAATVKAIKKGLTLEKLKELLTDCKEIWDNEVYIHGLFIAGLENETVQSLKDTAKWLRDEHPFDSWHMNALKFHTINNTSNDISYNSEYGRYPKSFGYNVFKDKNSFNQSDWVSNTGLTKDMANKISNMVSFDIYNRGIGLWAYGSFRMAGMSHEDIMNMDLREDDSPRTNALKFHEDFKNNYLNKVLQLNDLHT